MKNSNDLSTSFLKLAIVYLSTIYIALMLSSCSGDTYLEFGDPILENQPPVLFEHTKGTKVCTKRTIEYNTSYGWSVNHTDIYNYNYEGTRLLDWSLMRLVDNLTSVDTLITTYTNVYSNNQISSMTVESESDIVYYDFQYDDYNRVIQKIKEGVVESKYNYIERRVEIRDNQDLLIGEQQYALDNNNLKEAKWSEGSTTDLNVILEYSHDNKNMPFKNVESWYPLSGFRYLGINNIIELKYSNNLKISRDIQYDSDEFPTYIYETYSDGRAKIEVLEYND